MKAPGVVPITSLLLVSIFSVEGEAQNVYQVNARSQWETWTFPRGTIDLRADGSIKPVKFEPFFNAALNAGEFTHKLKRGDVQGGVWQVGSGTRSAANIIDGDLGTHWRPDPSDPLDKWWIEIDLGRAVAVKEIRLHFPDEQGARPLRQFRVFGSDGKLQSITEDVFSFNLIGGTTRWNEEQQISFPVAFGEATKTVLRLGVAPAGTDTSTAFAPLQYVRIIADVRSDAAALSEVEVISFGDNIAPGTERRGGFIDDQGKGRTAGINDGDVNTFWEELNWNEAVGDQAQWNWDLGAVYWVNRVIFVAFQETTTWGRPRILRHRLLASDGRRKSSGKIDFDVLFDFPEQRDWNNPEPVTYLLYPHQPIRNLFMIFSGSSSGAIAEAIIVPTGHMAQVELTSDFIEISARPKVLQSLEWESDLPPGTQILAQTRSGNTLVQRAIYYHRKGHEVTKDEYEALQSRWKGPVEEFIEPGQEWSGWSNVYQFSGQEFLSPSPRRYVQFKLVLKADRPEVAPSLHSLKLNYTDAFLSGVLGEVSPKDAKPGIPQKFTYVLSPDFGSGDRGFNRIRLQTPSRVDGDSLAVRIERVPVEPRAVQIFADSLLVELPRVVQGDAVEVDVHVNIFENPYLFNAFVGHTAEPELWQEVEPAGRSATTVFLPDIARTSNLLDAVSVMPPVLTPNGDGAGDQVEIRFAILKTDTGAEVGIYSLAGTLVSNLQGERGGDGLWSYRWAGVDQAGTRVPPGIYLCRIKLDAQAGTETLARTIGVAY